MKRFVFLSLLALVAAAPAIACVVPVTHAQHAVTAPAHDLGKRPPPRRSQGEEEAHAPAPI